MDNDAATDNAARSATDRESIRIGSKASHAGGIRQQLGQIAGMVFGVVRMTMGLGRWIEVPTGAGGIRRAAVALVMNVETVGTRRQAGNLGNDPHLVADLREAHRTTDVIACRRPQLRLGPGAAVADRSTTAKHSSQRKYRHSGNLLHFDFSTCLLGKGNR